MLHRNIAGVEYCEREVKKAAPITQGRFIFPSALQVFEQISHNAHYQNGLAPFVSIQACGICRFSGKIDPMTSTKRQDWDWRFKIELAVAALALFGFFVVPWLLVGADLIITYIETGDMPRPPPLDTDWTR